MSRRRKPKAEPVKLAKVIPFRDELRSELKGKDADIETAAIRDWNEADRLYSRLRDFKDQEEVQTVHRAVRRALKSMFLAKIRFEREFGASVEASSYNAALLMHYGDQLRSLADWNERCEQRLKRFAPDAQIYSLAEFRRFKNRVVNKEAMP